MPSTDYPFMSLTGRGHDTFVCRITCKKARIWTFFWLDRKQYEWFAPFRLAKMPPSVSCCWFQSAFLLAWWAAHASSLRNFCRLSFLKFEECLDRKFHPLKYFSSHRILKIRRSFECNLIPAISYRSDKPVHFSNNQFMNEILTWFDGINSSFRNLRIALSDLRFLNTFQFVKYGASAYFFFTAFGTERSQRAITSKFLIICSC